MHLFLLDGYLDVAATTLTDAKALLAALANPATSANIATIDRITGQIETLVASDTGEPLSISSIDDTAGTISSWVTDATQTIAFGLGDPNPTNAATYAATEEFTISGSARVGNIALNTTALQSALSGSRGMPPRGGSSQFIAHIRRTTSAGYTETVALLPVQVTQGVLQQDPIDHEFSTIASYVASAAASAAGATVSANSAHDSAVSATASKNEAADSESAALASAQAAALSQIAAAASQSSAGGSASSASGSASSASASALSATASASAASTSANTASTAASTASNAAATATGAILSTYKGTIAGASVPATAPATGDWYRIESSGTSQGVDWITGDIASYKGTSGQWAQISGGIVDNAVLARHSNARAPRQGLVSDGTNHADATLGSAIGTGDGSISITATVPPSNPSVSSCLLQIATARIEGTAGEVALAFWADGGLYVLFRGSDVSYRMLKTDRSIIAAYAGKTISVVVTRTGATVTIYVNGIAEACTATTTGGSPPVFSGSWTGTLLTIGAQGNAEFYTGTISVVRVFSRCLNAAEVLTLYEQGAPSASDYNNASNTAINTVTVVNHATYGYGTFSGASASGFTAAQAGATLGVVYTQPSTTITPGQKLRVTFTATLTSGQAPTCEIGTASVGTSSNSHTVTEGANSVELTSTGAGVFVMFYTNAATSYAISSIVVTRLGLILAPEDAPGNGYQWHDASGNKADIILPATGVAWSLPSVRPNKLRATLTWAGSHEAKSIGLIPANAVVTSSITTASAGSAGSGLTIGSVTTPNLLVAAAAYTTAKKVQTLAAQLPAGSATNDLTLVVDPDTSNYTGSIQVSINYVQAQ